MSPLNRVRLSAVVTATIIAGCVVAWICVHFNVSLNRYHLIPFFLIWFPVFGGAMVGGTWHESLRRMDGGRSDVFRYIEKGRD
jgi:hypothetical protein